VANPQILLGNFVLKWADEGTEASFWENRSNTAQGVFLVKGGKCSPDFY